MRTGKIARLPHDIREQLNRRLQDGEQGKSILKWLNALPEVQAVLKEHFEGHPVAASNLTEWKDGGYRDWQVRQDALAMVSNLGGEDVAGDSPLTGYFHEKFARSVSIHYAATAKAVLAAQLDSETKFSRLRQLCADVSRLRRIDYHAERINIERQRFALQQSKADQDREKEFAEWLKRPEIQMKYFPKQKRGLSREALALVDNYFGQGISPLDPEEAAKLYPFGRYATKPPIGFEMPEKVGPAVPSAPPPAFDDPSQTTFPFLEAADGGSSKSNSDQAASTTNVSQFQSPPAVGRAVPNPPPPSNNRRDANGKPTFGHRVPDSRPIQNPAPSIEHPESSTPDTCHSSPHPEEHCLTCGNRLPALLPDGTRPSPWCACGSPIAAPPGLSIRERCPYCSAPVPVHGWNIKRLHGRCLDCDQNLPPLSETAPLKWLLPDSEWQQRARDLASRGLS